MKILKSLKTVFSLIMIFSIAFGFFSLSVSAYNGNISDMVEFGSYPKRLVHDSELINKLEKLSLEWKSYGYYSGTGNYDDGKMVASDYMRYADIEFENCKYRAVTFDSFRPTFTGYTSSKQTDTVQEDNGYECNAVYWFKFEPLKWRVLNRENGYIICDEIIDSQPFSNHLYYNGKAYYMDNLSYDFSNYYVNSSIRKWLNNDFLNTAFSDNEKEKIALNYMDEFWVDIEDKVFLPSANEMKNDAVWKDSTSRISYGTDYAKCQGLYNINGKSSWRLRSPADWSHMSCAVYTDGELYSYDYYYCKYQYFTSYTGTGVRPAVKLRNLNDESLKITETELFSPKTNTESYNFSFFEKISSFFSGVSEIHKYFSLAFNETDSKTIIAMDSLDNGINLPCMESGWAREFALEKSTYETIKSKGFDYIRLPANLWCMLDENGKLDKSAAFGLDTAIMHGIDAGLTVILDFHGWMDLNENPSTENIDTLVSIWKQVSERYKDYPENLFFEIYNEPSNASGKMTDTRWNYIQNKVTSTIRNIDKNRCIVISTNNYNSVSSLKNLRYNKKDPYVIIDIHNYAPMDFTHQGAEWIDYYTDKKFPYEERYSEEFAESIKIAADFRNKTGTRILIGEFGVYLRLTSKQDVNKFLTEAVKVMRENNLPRAYWEFDQGFGAFDLESNKWKDFITDALFTKV